MEGDTEYETLISVIFSGCVVCMFGDIYLYINTAVIRNAKLSFNNVKFYFADGDLLMESSYKWLKMADKPRSHNISESSNASADSKGPLKNRPLLQHEVSRTDSVRSGTSSPRMRTTSVSSQRRRSSLSLPHADALKLLQTPKPLPPELEEKAGKSVILLWMVMVHRKCDDVVIITEFDHVSFRASFPYLYVCIAQYYICAYAKLECLQVHIVFCHCQMPDDVVLYDKLNLLLCMNFGVHEWLFFIYIIGDFHTVNST